MSTSGEWQRIMDISESLKPRTKPIVPDARAILSASEHIAHISFIATGAWSIYIMGRVTWSVKILNGSRHIKKNNHMKAGPARRDLRKRTHTVDREIHEVTKN